jgi:hypothetical protein
MTARRLAALLAAALAPTLVAAPLYAQTLPLSLKWSAPPGCPSADDVRREVARQAHVVPGRAPPELVAEARVEPIGERWRVELRTTRAGVAGYQTLEDDSCELLARATALVLALSLYDAGDAVAPAGAEPQERRVDPPPRRAPPSPPESPPAPDSESPPLEPERTRAEPPSSPAPRASEPAPAPLPPTLIVASVAPAPPGRSWALAAETRLLRGPLPAATVGFGLGLDMTRGRWLLRLRFLSVPSSEQETAAAPGVTARYQAWGGSVTSCAVAALWPRFALAGCVALDGSLLVATSSGAANTESAFAPWYAAGPAALARVRVWGRTRLELGTDLVVSIDRPRFALRHLGDVYEVPRLVPSAYVGLSVEL